MRQIEEPLPSDIKFTWEFTKAPDNLLLMRKIPPEEAPHPKFRIKLHYLELYVPRLIVNPKIEIDVDKQLRPTNDGGSGKRLTYFYSRVETTTELLPGGITYWESGSLFQGGNDTTFIFKHHI